MAPPRTGALASTSYQMPLLGSPMAANSARVSPTTPCEAISPSGSKSAPDLLSGWSTPFSLAERISFAVEALPLSLSQGTMTTCGAYQHMRGDTNLHDQLPAWAELKFGDVRPRKTSKMRKVTALGKTQVVRDSFFVNARRPASSARAVEPFG